MREVAADIRRSAGQGAEAAALTVLGLSLLLLRLSVRGSHPAFTLAAIYTVLLLLSLSARVPAEAPAPLGSMLALALGIAGLVLATLLAGARLPASTAAGALALNAAAGVAEEAFFRRFLYSRLIGLGAVAAIAGSALLFALVHLPAYGVAAFWIDVSAGLLLSWQRWASGNWGVPAATHVVANVLAVLR
jgi:membrane protease YdiL (CAAX protease family)